MATTNKNPWLVSNENTGSYGNNESNVGAVQQAQKPEALAERTEGSDDNSDATGVENVRYEDVAMRGGPRVPKNGAQVAAEGLTMPAAELARPDAVSNVESRESNAGAQGQTAQAAEPEYDFRGFDKQIAMLKDAAERTRGETEEERKRRQKRERSRKVIAAVTDGLAALSNLWFTSQYAPNMYNHKEQSQLDGLQRHYERMRAEREANRDKHLQYALRLGDVYNARAAALAARKARAEAARQAAAKDARDAELNEAEVARTQAQKRWYDAKADAEPVKAEAAKTKANKQVVRGRSRSGSGKAKWAVYDADGKVAKYVQTRDEAISETVRIGGKYPETISTRVSHNDVTKANETATIKTTPTADRSQGEKQVNAHMSAFNYNE